MSAVHYRYTDEQVAEDLNLYCALATEYVQNYTGTFHLLVAYRDRVGAGHGLTVPMVRATLNCMLHDAEVVNLPPPKYQARDYGSVTPITKARSFKDYTAPRRITWEDEDWEREKWADDEVVEIQRPRYVEMPVKWRHDYGIVVHKQARVVHRVHPDSYARWDTETATGSPVIWWRCKGYRGAHSMGGSKIIIMDSLEAAIHIMQSGGEIYLCRRCRELADGQQVLVEEVLALVDRGQVGTADLHPLRTWHSSAR